jgi:hypothetical protein
MFDTNLLPKGKDLYYFGFAVVCWAIWKCKNRAILDKKLIKRPDEIILHACTYISYWAGLFSMGIGDRRSHRVSQYMLLGIVHRILAQQKSHPTVRLLQAPRDEHPKTMKRTDQKEEESAGVRQENNGSVVVMLFDCMQKVGHYGTMYVVG